MIPTKSIREAIFGHIERSGLVDSVTRFNKVDLSAALEFLRDSSDSAAIIVPSRDSWEHQIMEGDNLPLAAEQRNEFEILVTKRDLRHGDDGEETCVQLKDQLCESLIWSDLGVPGLLCLPLETEPMVIAIDERRGREAWKITVEIRQLILS